MHLVVVDQFQVGDDTNNHDSGKDAPNAELRRSQFHVEATRVNVPAGDVLAGGEATGGEPLRHRGAEAHEADGDKERGDDRHDEHDGARADVQEETEEGRLLFFVGET